MRFITGHNYLGLIMNNNIRTYVGLLTLTNKIYLYLVLHILHIHKYMCTIMHLNIRTNYNPFSNTYNGNMSDIVQHPRIYIWTSLMYSHYTTSHCGVYSIGPLVYFETHK